MEHKFFSSLDTWLSPGGFTRADFPLLLHELEGRRWFWGIVEKGALNDYADVIPWEWATLVRLVLGLKN